MSDFKPRDGSVYLPRELLKQLRWIAAARNKGKAESENKVSADSVAEEMVREVIGEKYPELQQFSDKLREVEKQAVEAIKPS